MSRVTRHLAAVVVAGTIAAVPFAASSSAWASGDVASGDGLVNVDIGNITTNVNVPIQTAALNCVNVSPNVAVAAISKVDQDGGEYHCKNAIKQDVKIWNN
jgi:hypothetical protein